MPLGGVCLRVVILLFFGVLACFASPFAPQCRAIAPDQSPVAYDEGYELKELPEHRAARLCGDGSWQENYQKTRDRELRRAKPRRLVYRCAAEDASVGG